MKKNKNSIITLDVGGTYIKGNVLIGQSFAYNKYISYPSFADKKRDKIINNFCTILNALINQCATKTIDSVLMAFPGPFDYKNGISYLTSVSKYETLFGTNIEKEIKSKTTNKSLKKSEFFFMNDIEAFALGAINDDSALQNGKVLFIAIGTGTGSAFMINGKIIKEGLGIPENGWIYNIPFKSSIIDDYISARGLETIAGNYGLNLSGKELSTEAKNGNFIALSVFNEFGNNIKEALLPILNEFSPHTVVFGGNITKSYKFFNKQLDEALNSINIKIINIDNTSTTAFKGLIKVYEKRNEIQL